MDEHLTVPGNPPTLDQIKLLHLANLTAEYRWPNLELPPDGSHCGWSFLIGRTNEFENALVSRPKSGRGSTRMRSRQHQLSVTQGCSSCESADAYA